MWVKYAAEHFEAEEHLMRTQGYPYADYKEHHFKHNLFREQTATLTLNLDRDLDLDQYTVTVSKWLIEWFYDQVQNDDKKLAVFLKAHHSGNRLLRCDCPC